MTLLQTAALFCPFSSYDEVFVVLMRLAQVTVSMERRKFGRSIFGPFDVRLMLDCLLATYITWGQGSQLAGGIRRALGFIVYRTLLRPLLCGELPHRGSATKGEDNCKG